MIISTTSQLEGRPIAEYLGVVSSESVQGIYFVRDFFARFRDFFGGRSQTLESALREARSRPLKNSRPGHDSCKPMR